MSDEIGNPPGADEKKSPQLFSQKPSDPSSSETKDKLRRQHPKQVFLVRSIGALFCIGALLLTLAALGDLNNALNDYSRFSKIPHSEAYVGDSLRNMVLPSLILIFAIACFFSGMGLFEFKSSSRISATLLLAIFALASLPTIIGPILSGALVFFLLTTAVLKTIPKA